VLLRQGGTADGPRDEETVQCGRRGAGWRGARMRSACGRGSVRGVGVSGAQ
jgi:hypothetical protein